MTLIKASICSGAEIAEKESKKKFNYQEILIEKRKTFFLLLTNQTVNRKRKPYFCLPFDTLDQRQGSPSVQNLSNSNL